MKKSKIILLYNILLLTIVFLIKLNYEQKSTYKPNTKEIEGIIIDCQINNNKTNITIKSKEKVLVKYNNYYKCNLGDKIIIKGKIENPNNNRIFYQFNYKEYLLSKNIKVIFNAEKIKTIKKNQKIKYKIKTKIIKHINKYKSKAYLNALVLANTQDIEEKVKESYRNNGISYLLALSGTQITILSLIIKKIVKLFIKNEIKINIIVIIMVMLYTNLTSLSPSIIRATLSYIGLTVKKLLKLKIKNEYILIIILLLILNYNPYYIYNLGFKLSFIVSFYIIFLSKILKEKNYLKKSFIISLIAFTSSAPLIINTNYNLNFLNPILNIYFIPLFIQIIYPLTLLTIFLKPLDKLLYRIIKSTELLSLKIQKINISVPFAHFNIIEILIYYTLIYFVFYKIKKRKKNYMIIIPTLFIIHYNINYLNPISKVTMIDVGQGDSILLKLKNNKGNLLIDTGGFINKNIVSENILTPYLKSEGIKRLNYLIISHGDYDHMGEAINLVNNFKVEKVIFNCGEYNDLEKELIKVLDKKKIKYYSCIQELNIDKNKLYFLQTKEYDNENDNSNVIYTELNGYKFMFMGDASVTTEKEILNKYNLSNIDVLKVGHHGSKTSSGKEFIDEINPKYSIISVGKNNRYGHPNKEALDNLEETKIYRTDEDGSIMFKIKNNKLKIENCSP
ncbi:MAG: DNA internalization-related competence protein ComEC/Rec2 [Bacilli bacterium]|nr:DNA internalization-related competence protein ComEC/Rec2 [Bacilli bacterium]